MEISGECGGHELAAAPFVVKTYQMVSDPANSEIISWGLKNNSIIVFDPYAFSQTLLPGHFKHCNFSSFVRQLNTYGFRKVDSDRWEFAHSSFLRGQMHLLRHIVRKRKGRADELDPDEDDEALAMEVVRLKQDQRAIEGMLERMWSRVRETEKKPRHILGFLLKVVDDPFMAVRLKSRAGCEDLELSGWEKNASLRFNGEASSPAPIPAPAPDSDIPEAPPPSPAASPPSLAPLPATALCFGGYCVGGGGVMGSDLGAGAGVWGMDFFSVDNGF